ncbi:DNA-3-methyladenine glycosylase I [Bombilactobacillus bombi]|uniref:DNA-3-methyladenine glycosylase I n=1 Tax=Bombilactobacillus bombi TaxID=1303590 RepID=UPI000E585A0A|nr:DNA-3-methyladenine glycosylase I [Bombilactobacillus bombi]AXX64152.1 DNA-3-methyladenine glycosylase I [Bombilactobacillus bombi]
MIESTKIRCQWVPSDNQLMQTYHDLEWGTPTTSTQALFELLTLEIFQSGLSWQIILNKRDHFRRAFAQFSAAQVANFNQQDIENLMNNADIVRNRRKILATINNAQVIVNDFPDNQFSEYIWSFTGYHVIKHHYAHYFEIPKFDSLAVIVSQNLRQRHFQFIGPVTIYSFLQASGIVNDHELGCFRSD